jgi:hypothetical protein
MTANNHSPQTRWEDRKQWRVVGAARHGQPALEVETSQNMAQRIGRSVTTYIRYCASGRHAIHTAEEIGGVCAVCEQVLCSECAKHLCALCGAMVCLKESMHTSAGDLCSTHGFLEAMVFVLKGGRNEKKV